MICKLFACRRCRNKLLGRVDQFFFRCAACGHAFTPARYRLVVKKGGQVGRLRMVTGRSLN